MRRLQGLALLLGVGFAGACLAGQAGIGRSEISQSGQEAFGVDLALGGFDTVAYHTLNRAVPGAPAFRVSWKGAEWRFATAATRDLFVRAPERYAPQFGGYCAFAVAYGSAAEGDPRVFAIVEGKLYLNINESVQSTWQRDRQALIKRGNANWPGVLR